MLKKLQSKKEGFTLVEMIVVIAILVILISLLVPNITGYIDKSNQTAVAAEAKTIFTAAQSACAMLESSNSTKGSDAVSKTITYGDNTLTAYCLSDNTVAHVLAAPDSASTRDEHLAKALCDILGVSEGNDYFDFKQGTAGSYEPYGQTVSAYDAAHSQPGLVIAYTRSGVHLVEWGHDGYIARVDSGGNVTCTKDGAFASVS